MRREMIAREAGDDSAGSERYRAGLGNVPRSARAGGDDERRGAGDPRLRPISEGRRVMALWAGGGRGGRVGGR